MNKFASAQNSGLLQDVYGNESITPLQAALKRKMLKMRQDVALKAEMIQNPEMREKAMTKHKK